MSILNMILPGGGSGGYQLGVLSSDKTDIDLTYSEPNTTFTISYNGDGDIVIENSNESVVSVELVSGTTYRVNGVADGDAVLTISATPTVNYFTPETVEIEVNYVSAPPASSMLNENDWDVISQISQMGLAANYWSVGDRKAVILNGTIGGNLTLSNTTFYVYILGINHKNQDGITFGTFKTALTDGRDVALVDSGCDNSKTSGTWFNINNSSSTSGGWKKCRMRYYVLGSTNSVNNDAPTNTATSPKSNSLMAALPSALRAVMKPMTVYSDNTGGGSDTASYVTATIDYLPLLAEYEVFGSRGSANSAEQNQQAQYQYYKNGNSKVKYKHNATSTSCYWWLRSTRADLASGFCDVNTNGTAASGSAGYSRGVAPAFLV